ncbi:hypothetical protein [Shewanella sp. YLB-07]|uniref:hypothetical protein n=1 Tax=Shewanella sp. YLB-07 TaxID=2601268 RepID=UPI00128D1F30|nr:hypothetical protein [Shewanella sp. YLB-07]MPY23574.1 hypothetical protein [Shewanella sp. YLB-07]
MCIPLRYYDTELQKQLINSYVSGLMSYRARKRMRNLLQQLPDFEARLLQVEAEFQALHMDLLPNKPKFELWGKIQERLGWQTVRWWQKINFWRAGTGALAFSLMLSVGVQLQDLENVESEYVPISYVGILNADNTQASLAVAVHRATDAGDAPWMMTLHLTQPWSQLEEVASLWITDNKGHKLSMGQIQVKDTQEFVLTASQWQFIQGAVWMELIADNSGGIILQGRCLSLAQWSS